MNDRKEADTIRIYRDIIPRVRREVVASKTRIRIFSPYLTSSVAKKVLQGVPPENCEIYTLFNASVFITGSSSIQTIIDLSVMGYTIFHLPGLHAKMTIIPEQFAYIGSQNLTYMGKRHLEASLSMVCRKDVQKASDFADQMMGRRRLITHAMMTDMEKYIEEAIGKWKEIQKKSREIDELIEERDLARMAEEEDTRKMEQETQKRRRIFGKRIRKLGSNINRYNLSNGIKGSVVIKRTGHTTSTISFAPDLVDKNLTYWKIEKEFQSLAPYMRYLCIIENNGKIAWVRLVKSRITFACDSVEFPDPVDLGGLICRVSFFAIWDDLELEIDQKNIEINIKPIDLPGSMSVKAWFDSNGFRSAKVNAENTQDKMKGLAGWLKRHREKFQEIIMKEFLKPFKYDKKLEGIQMDRFLGPVDSRYNLRLACMGDIRMLVARKI